MKCFRYCFDTKLEFSRPVDRHNFVLRCLPLNCPEYNVLRSEVTVYPQVPLVLQQDAFGNQVLVGSCRSEHEMLIYHAEGDVQIDPAKQRRESIHPMYRYPSPLTHPSPALEAFFHALPLSGKSGLQQVRTILDAVSDCFTYCPGSTGVHTVAADAFAQKSGVCQDYAHVMIVLCRLAGVPARYCMGLSEGEGTTHAWVEAYIDGRWVGCDPTRRCMVDERYLRFAVGRDFCDCPVERGTFWGNADQLQTVFAQMSEQ